MTEENDDYYVAELVEQHTDVSELSEEELDQVAELQKIHREVKDQIEFTPAGEEHLSEDQKRKFELLWAEMYRLGREQSETERAQLFAEFGIDKEKFEAALEAQEDE